MKNFYLYPLENSISLSVACHRISCLSNSVDHKEDLHCHQNCREDRDAGYEIENEVTDSETLNLQTFFSQAFCKVASFPLALDLMHECCVISFPDVFHSLIWRSNCIVAYLHISTSQKLRGNKIGIQSLTLRTSENNGKLKLLFVNKTHFYSY